MVPFHKFLGSASSLLVTRDVIRNKGTRFLGSNGGHLMLFDGYRRIITELQLHCQGLTMPYGRQRN